MAALKKQIKRLEAENKNLRQQIAALSACPRQPASLIVIPFASSSTISSNTATLGAIKPGFIP